MFVIFRRFMGPFKLCMHYMDKLHANAIKSISWVLAVSNSIEYQFRRLKAKVVAEQEARARWPLGADVHAFG
jgi:hypothetical protein